MWASCNGEGMAEISNFFSQKEMIFIHLIIRCISDKKARGDQGKFSHDCHLRCDQWLFNSCCLITLWRKRGLINP